MSGSSGDSGGLRGLLGSLAKAIGGAFVEGLERQMQEHLASILSSPNLATRSQTAMRLRAVLERPEFALPEATGARIDTQLKSALASADAKPVVASLAAAAREAGWKAMQRLMFYQLVAPHPNVNVNIGPTPAGVAGAGADGAPSGSLGKARPEYLRLVPAPGPIDPAMTDDPSSAEEGARRDVTADDESR